MHTNADPLAVVAIFHARADKQEELGQLLLSLVEPTREEAGSMWYHICQSERDADEWVAIEHWRDRGAFDFHMSTPYIRAFLARVPMLCDRDPDIRFHAFRSPVYSGDEEWGK